MKYTKKYNYCFDSLAIWQRIKDLTTPYPKNQTTLITGLAHITYFNSKEGAIYISKKLQHTTCPNECHNIPFKTVGPNERHNIPFKTVGPNERHNIPFKTVGPNECHNIPFKTVVHYCSS